MVPTPLFKLKIQIMVFTGFNFRSRLPVFELKTQAFFNITRTLGVGATNISNKKIKWSRLPDLNRGSMDFS